MRQLFVKVPDGDGDAVLDLAVRLGSLNSVSLCAHDEKGKWDVVMVHISNQQVAPLLEQIDTMPKAHVTLLPHNVLPMASPNVKAAEEITDISALSPIEIWLNSLQSIGSWKSFLGYTLAASIVVWSGLFTNSIYLIVAAMLIAPFAGPAMNAAIATASGDRSLLWRSLLRYASSITLMIGITWGLSLIFQLKIATTLMVDISEVSSFAVLLPLAAGAAGALNLVQAEKSSLVSGTAVGVLVAASLAPPAGVIGMAAALGRWSMCLNGTFVLLLQLVAINLGGTIVLRIFGLDTEGALFSRGTPWIFRLSIAASVVVLSALLGWQLQSPVDLQRSTVASRAASLVEEVVNQSELVHLVETNVRFTRPSIKQQKTLLVVLYVQRTDDVGISNEEIRLRLSNQVASRLRTLDGNIVPLVDLSVLEE